MKKLIKAIARALEFRKPETSEPDETSSESTEAAEPSNVPVIADAPDAPSIAEEDTVIGEFVYKGKVWDGVVKGKPGVFVRNGVWKAVRKDPKSFDLRVTVFNATATAEYSDGDIWELSEMTERGEEILMECIETVSNGIHGGKCKDYGDDAEVFDMRIIKNVYVDWFEKGKRK